MRKLLLATTAIASVALMGSAHAASSPVTLNVGGYTDFVAGVYHESGAVNTGRASRDFETEYKLNIDAMGKASNGIEYGANVSLWNGPEATNNTNTGTVSPWSGGADGVSLNSAYVWLSGAFGKVLVGDEHGASDLVLYTPTVGEGQVDGRYMDFVDPATLARVYASGIDNTEHSTKITYYTPKVGNAENKVQLGVSYAPNMYDYGSNVVKLNTTAGTTSNSATSPYQDVIEAAVEYWGNFRPVNVAVSADIMTGSAGANGAVNPAIFLNAPAASGASFQDFTSWGLGLQLGTSYIGGLTIGGSYQDLGRYGASAGQNKNQEIWTLGGKYEFDKVGVGASWLTGQQYDNMLLTGTGTTATQTNYVSSFDALSAGATYTWFPGLSTNVDGTLFFQGVTNQPNTNEGFVLLVSQKMTF